MQAFIPFVAPPLLCGFHWSFNNYYMNFTNWARSSDWVCQNWDSAQRVDTVYELRFPAFYFLWVYLYLVLMSCCFAIRHTFVICLICYFCSSQLLWCRIQWSLSMHKPYQQEKILTFIICSVFFVPSLQINPSIVNIIRCTSIVSGGISSVPLECAGV